MHACLPISSFENLAVGKKHSFTISARSSHPAFIRAL